MKSFLQKKNIKAFVAIVLSVALFFVGVLTSPPSESTDPSDDTTQTTPSDDENNDSTTPDNSTDASDNVVPVPGGSSTNSNTTAQPDSSMPDPDNSTTNNNTTTPSDNSTPSPDNSTTNNNITTNPDNTTNSEEKVKMVWIPSSGTKYHSKSSCSNMNSPRQIPLEDAKNQGYTACKKCH